jgi:hypothetical protein
MLLSLAHPILKLLADIHLRRAVQAMEEMIVTAPNPPNLKIPHN